MKRFFNTAGPVKCEKHYCLPPLERFDLAELLSLVDQEKYFVLHAPRQTGKTSCLLALMKYLNQQGKFKSLYFNVEMAQSARENVEDGIRSIMGELAQRAEDHIQDTFCNFSRSIPNTGLSGLTTRKPVRSSCFRRFCSALSMAAAGSSGNTAWGGCGRICW